MGGNRFFFCSGRLQNGPQRRANKLTPGCVHQWDQRGGQTNVRSRPLRPSPVAGEGRPGRRHQPPPRQRVAGEAAVHHRPAPARLPEAGPEAPPGPADAPPAGLGRHCSAFWFGCPESQFGREIVFFRFFFQYFFEKISKMIWGEIGKPKEICVCFSSCD